MKRTMVLCLFVLVASCGTDKKPNNSSPSPEPEGPYFECVYTYVPETSPGRQTVVTLIVEENSASMTSSYEVDGQPSIVSKNSRKLSGNEDHVLLGVSHFFAAFHKDGSPHAHFYSSVSNSQVDVECEAK